MMFEIYLTIAVLTAFIANFCFHVAEDEPVEAGNSFCMAIIAVLAGALWPVTVPVTVIAGVGYLSAGCFRRHFQRVPKADPVDAESKDGSDE